MEQNLFILLELRMKMRNVSFLTIYFYHSELWPLNDLGILENGILCRFYSDNMNSYNQWFSIYDMPLITEDKMEFNFNFNHFYCSGKWHFILFPCDIIINNLTN